MKTQFLDALNAIAASDKAANQVNLVQAANDNGIGLTDTAAQLAIVLNAVMKDKDIILNGTRHSDTAVFLQFKKATQRHNQQVLWRAFRPHFASDGECSAVLGHFTLSKGKVNFSEQSRDVKVTRYLTFDAAADSLLAFGAKLDRESGQIMVELTGHEIDVLSLMAQYSDWKSQLKDFTPVIEPDARTKPDATLATEGELASNAKLLKQVETGKAQHAIDQSQIKSAMTDNAELVAKLASLQVELEKAQASAQYWRGQALIKSSLLTSKPASRKRNAA